MLDFADQAGLDAYNDDDVHHEVGDYNASIAKPEMTARVDWNYDGDPLINPGHVRHSEMFVWRDDADDAAKEAAMEQARRLGDAGEVEKVTVAANVGPMATDFDWILDVQTADKKKAKSLLDGDLYSEVMKAIAPVTKYEWTARVNHVMRGM
jgi:hypothetical protein